MLFRGEANLPAIQVSWSVILPVVIVTVLFFLIVITYGVKAQRRRPDYGREALVGKRALVIAPLTPEGLVRVEGELWRAVADENHQKGEILVVLEVKGMQLKVGAGK
jgi:membrane-bound serine protease (ClpP class)